MIANALRDAVVKVLPLSALAVSHAATVRVQHDDGTLDVDVETREFGEPVIGALSDVPFRVGIPGARVMIPEGSRVRVAFENADRSAPYAYALDSDQSAARGVARLADSVDCGTLRFDNIPNSGIPVGVLVTYIPPGIAVPTIFSILGLVSVAPDAQEVALKGIIDSASGSVKLVS